MVECGTTGSLTTGFAQITSLGESALGKWGYPFGEHFKCDISSHSAKPQP